MTHPVYNPGPQSVAGTNEHAAAERRAAARALLSQPILAGSQHAEALALVRRHKQALRQSFHTQLGYPLVVEPTFARLVKTPPPLDTPPRGARRPNGTAFNPRTYTYLALVCAGLMAPGTGDQVLLSALVEQLRADAASADITLDDTLPERRALVAAIAQLIDWGVLVETDGSITAWGERREEALLSINQALLPHILARPLSEMRSANELWNTDSHLREAPRPALRRRLVEHPLTRREDLTEAEADALSRERRDIARALDDTYGLTLEVRLEGALAYDPDETLTDLDFPGQGTVRQAALLLLDALIDTYRPQAGTTARLHPDPVIHASGNGGGNGDDSPASLPADGRVVPGLLVEWNIVTDNLEDLTARNAKAWRNEVTDDLPRLLDDVLDTLTAVSLATVTDDGLILHPACYRYRPEPVRTPSRARTPAPTAAATHEHSLFDLTSPATSEPETP